MASRFASALTLGTMTGLRSAAGIAALTRQRRSGWMTAALAAALGEFVADKSPFVGSRVAPVPLLGRAVLGGIAGALVSEERGRQPLPGIAVGAAAAVAAAYAGHRFRTRTPIGNIAGGVIEDALVVALGALYLRRQPGH